MSDIPTPEDIEAMLEHFAAIAYEVCCYRDRIEPTQLDARREADFRLHELYRKLRPLVSEDTLQTLFTKAQVKAARPERDDEYED